MTYRTFRAGRACCEGAYICPACQRQVEQDQARAAVASDPAELLRNHRPQLLFAAAHQAQAQAAPRSERERMVARITGAPGSQFTAAQLRGMSDQHLAALATVAAPPPLFPKRPDAA